MANEVGASVFTPEAYENIISLWERLSRGRGRGRSSFKSHICETFEYKRKVKYEKVVIWAHNNAINCIAKVNCVFGM